MFKDTESFGSLRIDIKKKALFTKSLFLKFSIGISFFS